ncbi:LacI family transcriptional regulator [bacterium]|nr:MAG: LacI family transcriptional regulator [bacterium]
MATIRQVASHAGVSIGTVSKVLNGRDEKVDPAAKARILGSIRTLRYKPPAFEQNQKAAIAHNLGMIVPDLMEHPLRRHGYLHLLLDGVLERAASRGWSVTIFAETMWDDVGNAVRRKYDGKCDGLVAAAPQPNRDIVASLHQRGVPLVQVGTTAWIDDVSSVDIDNFEAGRLVAQHLIDLGHRRLGFLAHHQNQVSGQERFAGFRSVAGDDVYFLCEERGETTEDLARRFAAMGPNRPTAFMAWHDSLAAEFYVALQKLGIKVPEDVSLAGVDNSQDGIEAGLSLTTIDNPLHRLGLLAADMTINRVLDPTLPREIIKLPPRLLVKESTASPKPETSLLPWTRKNPCQTTKDDVR